MGRRAATFNGERFFTADTMTDSMKRRSTRPTGGGEIQKRYKP